MSLISLSITFYHFFLMPQLKVGKETVKFSKSLNLANLSILNIV
jgi:hypothetical protein